jgi:hypothetical protein
MLSTPQWYSIYRSAMLERDRHKAFSEIACAEKAIQERVAELRAVPAANAREEQDLNQASTHLRILHQQIGMESEGMFWD